MNERHEKWTPVSPGTVIPAGQPYRIEFPDGSATESPNRVGHKAGSFSQPGDETFIDSSWKPPLVLPTEPTWGIAVTKSGYVGTQCWHLHRFSNGEQAELRSQDECVRLPYSTVLDFIPLTDEQVQRIEAAR